MARILIEAIQSGQQQLALEIISKCGSSVGIDCQTSRRDGTALFFCCSRGYLSLAQLLLERGASVASTDKNRATPLHGAVDNGHLEVAKLLISQGASINAQTFRGDTPLHLAAYRGFGEITQYLVAAGADFRLVNSSCFTAENEAKGRGHHELCNYLHSLQYAGNHSSDQCGHFMDSMIQLDPPTGLQSSVTDQFHPSNNQTQEFTNMDLDRHLPDQVDYPETSPKSEYSDYHRLNQLSVISLDPPTNFPTASYVTSSPKRFNSRHHPEKPAPVLVLPPQPSVPPLSPKRTSHVPPPQLDVLSNYKLPGISLPRTPCLNPPGFESTFNSSPGLFLNSALYGFQRRPSAGSSSSCYSDVSVSSGSDVGSLPSGSSDGSGFFSEARREDLDSQERHLVNQCLEDQFQNDDLQLMALGVKNPPSGHHKRQLSLTSESAESAEFTDIYDSTLFSLNSIGPGSHSFSESGKRLEFSHTSSEKHKRHMDVQDSRPRLNRAASENCSPTCHQLPGLKVRPGFNKSISSDNRTRVPQMLSERTEHDHYPVLNRATSNDLSLTLTDKPPHSMTIVNIPLNST